MSQHTQLDLRIIGRKKPPIFWVSNKGLANLPAGVGPNRNVLEIGILGTQSAGGCHILHERSVHSLRFWINQRQQGIGIGTSEFCKLPVTDNFLRQLMLFGKRL